MTGTGLVLPYRGWNPSDVVELGVVAERLGYQGVWAAEVAGYDGFALLAAIAARTVSIHLGTAIVPVASRTPALIAMSAATVCGLAPRRVTVGIGVSSPEIIEDWHGRRSGQPLETVRDTCRILAQIFAGQVTDYHGKVLRSTGFALACPLDHPPPILVAALGPQMRALAASVADGVIFNFVPRSRLPQIGRAVPANRSAHALVRVAVTDDDDTARWRVRRELASYLRFDQYRRWLTSFGYQDAVTEVRRGQSLDQMAHLVPDDLLDDVAVIGDVARCRLALAQFHDAGVTPLVVPVGPDDRPAVVEGLVAALAPTAP